MSARGGAWAVAAIVGALVGTLLVPLGAAAPAQAAEKVVSVPTVAAANPSEFRPGYIITDAQFYDSSAMTASQIQAFLDSKIGTCLNGNCLNVVTIDYPGRNRDVSSSTGNLICEAIPSGSYRVSELIYRAQVACGISAKVVLVTLQKEQGLVTKRSPSDTALKWAMGMACPDTAPCDTAFAGLGTQIVTGTRQLKAYKASAFARQPGTHFIGYHPDGSCGGTYVDVLNYATAALYNYTPYQPNSASLGNLYGTGDSCSSYGNRNFWAYYTDWFGNPLGEDGSAAVVAKYQESGGASGPLGAITMAENCTMSTFVCGQRHVGGTIYWTSIYGARVVLNDYDTVYRANGGATGPLGAPRSERIDVLGNPNGDGGGQLFEFGTIYTSSNGMFAVSGAILSIYHEVGGNSAAIGWPIGVARCSGTSCGQQFMGGFLGSSSSGGFSVLGDYATVYVASGGLTGTLGVPAGPKVAVSSPRGAGFGQQFTAGTIYSTTTYGAFAVTGSTRDLYWRMGSNQGVLGWPTGALTCVADVCTQAFQGGLVASTAGRSARVLFGDYISVYQAHAAELGFPTSDAVAVSGGSNGSGNGQTFDRGTIYSSAAGTFTVLGAVRDEFWRAGSMTGPLGWPTADQTCADGVCSQTFQGGTVFASSTVGAAVPTAYVAAYLASGGPSGPLGRSTSWYLNVPSNPNGAGGGQTFANGTIYSSTAGAFAVWGAVRDEYWAKGGNSGRLGWPTSAAVCADGVCTQQFQGGRLPTEVGQITALYASLGGSTGILGPATGGVVEVPPLPNGAGSGQQFRNGTIYLSSAGAFAVTGKVRSTYWANGSVSGPMGWPTGAETCSSGACSQAFQRGTVFTWSNGSAAVPTSYVAAFTAAGGPTGGLGSSTSWYLDIPSNPNGPGGGQVFTAGTIYSSTAAGAFAVTGKVRDRYWAAGSNPGPLGWPTGAMSCASGVCSQTFQGGTVHATSSVAAAIPTAYADAYAAAGGITGPLGASTSWYIDIPSNPNGPGGGQVFAGGTIYSSTAGAFAVSGPIRTEYWARGSNPGPLGWPTGAMSCTGGVCTQTFQGGTITR